MVPAGFDQAHNTLARDPVSLHNLYQREWERFDRLTRTKNQPKERRGSATMGKVADAHGSGGWLLLRDVL